MTWLSQLGGGALGFEVSLESPVATRTGQAKPRKEQSHVENLHLPQSQGWALRAPAMCQLREELEASMTSTAQAALGPDHKVAPAGRGEPVSTTQSLAEELGMQPRLSAPIPFDQIQAGSPYILRDEYGRILGSQNGGRGSFNWALMGLFGDNANNITMGVVFEAVKGNISRIRLGDSVPSSPQPSPPPRTSGTYLTGGNSDEWNWMSWQTKSTSDAWLFQVNGSASTVIINDLNGGMVLYADGQSSNWLYENGAPNTKPLPLTVHKFYYTYQDIKALVSATWPGITNDFSYKPEDYEHELVMTEKIQAIYAASGLSSKKWTPEVFDCDDFAYQLKATASLQAYQDLSNNAAVARPYAVGVVFGKSSSGVSHAANVFVDYSGSVMIMDASKGGIILPGKNWADPNSNPYTPTFLLM